MHGRVAELSGQDSHCHPHLVRPDGTGLKKLPSRSGYRGLIQPDDKGATSLARG
jgi:hypothetical protein